MKHDNLNARNWILRVKVTFNKCISLIWLIVLAYMMIDYGLQVGPSSDFQ